MCQVCVCMCSRLDPLGKAGGGGNGCLTRTLQLIKSTTVLLITGKWIEGVGGLRELVAIGSVNSFNV